MSNKLIRETSCFNHLRWRLVIEDEIAAEDFQQQLTKIDYTDTNHPLYPKIIEMEHVDGYKVIFVPATNRIQIRLSVDSDENTRIQQAQKIGNQLNALFCDFRGTH